VIELIADWIDVNSPPALATVTTCCFVDFTSKFADLLAIDELNGTVKVTLPVPLSVTVI
jgi:hypothetical protein